MNSGAGLTIVGLTLAVLLIASSAAAAQPSVRFAAYNIEVSLPSGHHSVLLNETVGQSSKPGFSDLILQLTGSQQSLTYSRLVNASANFLPYLSNLAPQAFDYGNGTTANVHANFSATGTTTVTFQGSQYTLSVYTFEVSASYGGKSIAVNGTLETFPSSLVYSAKAGNSEFSLQAVLVATNLQLTQSSSQTSTAAYVGAGLGVGGVALAAVFLARRKDKKVQDPEQKPSHWVD